MAPSKILNVIIPMAGAGKRFADAGFAVPKPFIDVGGMPMIELVLSSFSKHENLKFILVMQMAHLTQFSEQVEVLKVRFNVTIAVVEGLTLGQTCTALAAHRHIEPASPLLIANCDEVIKIDLMEFENHALENDLSGLIATFTSHESRWSFARTDSDGIVVETAEKRPISTNASLGWYYFSEGKKFFEAAIDQIVANDTYNGEFYVCPLYNYLIRQGERVGIFHVEENVKIGLGTPAELDAYMESKAASK